MANAHPAMQPDSYDTYNTPATSQSMIELYIELDAIEWYYKFLAAIANWSMLAGFIVFPNAFDEDNSKFRIQADTLRVVAVCLLVFGYILTGIMCWRFKNLLFQVESIFLPGFSSSTLGFMSSLFNVYGKNYKDPKDQWSASAILAIVLSSVFMLLYGATSLNANRKLDRIRKHDDYRRQLAVTQEDVAELTEEERTRRNLLTLLLSPQQQQQQHPQGYTGITGATTAPAFEPTNTSASRMSRIYQSQSYPGTPNPNTPATGSSMNSATYLMTNYPAYSPPSGLGIAGVGRNSREGLLPSPGIEQPSSRWGIERPASAGGVSTRTMASTNTANNPSSRKPLPKPPTLHTANTNEAYPSESGPSNQQDTEKEAVQGPQARQSIFAGLSATVGHGRERVGAGWTSWSPV